METSELIKKLTDLGYAIDSGRHVWNTYENFRRLDNDQLTFHFPRIIAPSETEFSIEEAIAHLIRLERVKKIFDPCDFLNIERLPYNKGMTLAQSQEFQTLNKKPKKQLLELSPNIAKYLSSETGAKEQNIVLNDLPDGRKASTREIITYCILKGRNTGDFLKVENGKAIKISLEEWVQNLTNVSLFASFKPNEEQKNLDPFRYLLSLDRDFFKPLAHMIALSTRELKSQYPKINECVHNKNNILDTQRTTKEKIAYYISKKRENGNYSLNSIKATTVNEWIDSFSTPQLHEKFPSIANKVHNNEIFHATGNPSVRKECTKAYTAIEQRIYVRMENLFYLQEAKTVELKEMPTSKLIEKYPKAKQVLDERKSPFDATESNIYPLDAQIACCLLYRRLLGRNYSINNNRIKCQEWIRTFRPEKLMKTFFPDGLEKVKLVDVEEQLALDALNDYAKNKINSNSESIQINNKALKPIFDKFGFEIGRSKTDNPKVQIGKPVPKNKTPLTVCAVTIAGTSLAGALWYAYSLL